MWYVRGSCLTRRHEYTVQVRGQPNQRGVQVICTENVQRNAMPRYVWSSPGLPRCTRCDVSTAGSPFARNCLESRLQSGGTSKYRRHDRPRPTTDIDTGTVAVDIDMTSRPIRTKTRQNESPLERNVRKRRFYMHVIQQRTTRIF